GKKSFKARYSDRVNMHHVMELRQFLQSPYATQSCQYFRQFPQLAIRQRLALREIEDSYSILLRNRAHFFSRAKVNGDSGQNSQPLLRNAKLEDECLHAGHPEIRRHVVQDPNRREARIRVASHSPNPPAYSSQ